MGVFKNWFGGNEEADPSNEELDPTKEYMDRDTGYETTFTGDTPDSTDKTGPKKGSDQKKEGKFWGKAGKYLGLLGAGYAIHKNRKEIPFDNRAFNETLLQNVIQNMSDNKMNPVQQTQAILEEPGGSIDIGDIVSKIGQGYGNKDFDKIEVGGQGTPIDPVDQGMLGFYGGDFKW